MKGMLFKMSRKGDVELIRLGMIFVILMLLWPVLQGLIVRMDLTAGLVDPNIVVLVLLSIICFLSLIGLCWWLFKKFLLVLGLPDPGSVVLRFNELMLWRRFMLYYGMYALLLLAGTGCLMAVL